MVILFLRFCMMHLRISLFFSFLLWITGIISAQPQTKYSTEEYIDRYKEIAVLEMMESGIPASITLAQGILESSSGNSRLAREGNNHFGIKCHKDWQGPGIYMDDDAKNECFRKYENAEQSFRDHTVFLSTRDRYAFLFKLNPGDYEAWAKGLKKAGYATNPRYADILIDLIKRYELYRFDNGIPVDTQIVAGNDSLPVYPAHHNVFMVNRIKTVYLFPNESLDDIARLFDLKALRLERYNEVNRTRQLDAGMHVFLQPKRHRGAVKQHRVNHGETMYMIAQMHGIRINDLYKRNHIPQYAEPAEGEKLYLRGHNPKPVKLRPKENMKPEEVKGSMPETDEPLIIIPLDTLSTSRTDTLLIEPEDSMSFVKNKQISKPDSIDESLVFHPLLNDIPDSTKAANPLNRADSLPLVKQPASIHYIYHIVKSKETLYSLSKKYETTVEQLKVWNNLDDNHIEIGQKLIVGKEN